MKMSSMNLITAVIVMGFLTVNGCTENVGAGISETPSSEFARGGFQGPIRSSLVNSAGKLFFATNNDHNFLILQIDLETSELDTLLNRETITELGIELANPASQFVLGDDDFGISIYDMRGRANYFFDLKGNLIHSVRDSLGLVGGGSRLFTIDQNSFIEVNQSSRQEYLFEDLSASTTFQREGSYFSFESYQDLKAVKDNFMLKNNPVFAQSPDQNKQFVAYQYSSWIFKKDAETGNENIIREPFDKNFPQIAPLHMDDGSIAFDPPNAFQHTSHILDMAADNQYLFVVYSGKTINEQGHLFFSGLSEDKVFDLVENTGDSILVYDLDGRFLLQKELDYRVYSLTSVKDNLCLLAFDDDYLVYCLDKNDLLEDLD
ncbi:MAG: hypothetical protein LAT84_11150 [Balneolia bacterium]|nr:hypothetical protein [Balneolia bacterium]